MIVLVIPYRDRRPQLERLIARLHSTSADRIVVAEQAAGLPFNRGWVKNAGFLAAELDDADTVYFHDVDLLPGPATVYPAAPADSVLHLYGHTHCLGGVVGMRAVTFRRLGGFPTGLWAWGHEDAALQQTCIRAGVPIDRSVFCDRFSDDVAWREMDAAGRPLPGKQAMAEFVCGLKSGRKSTAAPPARALQGGLKSTLFSTRPGKIVTTDGASVVRHVVVGFRNLVQSGRPTTGGGLHSVAGHGATAGSRDADADTDAASAGDIGTVPPPATKRRRTSADHGPGRRPTAHSVAAPSTKPL